MIEELKKHLQSVGKTDESWLDLAKRFNILPNGTNKQRSDKVRKIWNKINSIDLVLTKDIQTKEYLDKKAGETLQTGRTNLSDYKNIVFGETVFHGIDYTLQDGSTVFVPNKQVGGCEVFHGYGKINSPYNYGTPFPFTGIGDVVQPVIKPNTPSWEQQLNQRSNNEWEEFRKWKESKVQTNTRKKDGINIVISCLHVPYENKELVIKLCSFIQDNKDKIVGFHLIGDYLDLRITF